jgi:hypothetical protein
VSEIKVVKSPLDKKVMIFFCLSFLVWRNRKLMIMMMIIMMDIDLFSSFETSDHNTR